MGLLLLRLAAPLFALAWAGLVSLHHCPLAALAASWGIAGLLIGYCWLGMLDHA